MTEHKGTSFYNSCVKVPVHPFSRQPTPSYERYDCNNISTANNLYNKQKRNLPRDKEIALESEGSSATKVVDTFVKFLESIPDYGQVHHLSNEQFKQKVDYLRRKQKLLLKNLQDSLATCDSEHVSEYAVPKCNNKISKNRSGQSINDLILSGKKCYLEDSRSTSPAPLPSSKCSGLSLDQSLITNSFRCNRRDTRDEEMFDEAVCLPDKDCSLWSKLNNVNDDAESDIDSIETRSLPASITKEWQPTVPKPFSFTLKEEAEKYMTYVEMEEERRRDVESGKRRSYRKRRVRPIPLTSKVPLYEKLLADKEERSRMVREESALNLMAQVRPFRLECDRRAWRSLARSSPEIRSESINTSAKFKAKPVPKNLFATDVYDRMLEDEYYRQLQKKIRAAQLMKSSSLPPSMARRERVRSACTRFQKSASKNCDENAERKSIVESANDTSVPFERSKSLLSLLPLRGNNLAAILRCQVSREKLERDIRAKMEEKRREQEAKIRESMIGRSPVWRALRSAARHEHERDLNMRTSLRRDEAREQAERHRVQMEVMLDRVTQIPTLFERHSQDYQPTTRMQGKVNASKQQQRRKKRKERKPLWSNMIPYMYSENVPTSDSGSPSGSACTPSSTGHSSKSSDVSASQASEKSTSKGRISMPRKKGDRGQLKVSINETAELIGDQERGDKFRPSESLIAVNESHEDAMQTYDHVAER